MRLATDEFIRRFLMHVLPDGFHRIRHYRLIASGTRKRNVETIRRLREFLKELPNFEDIEAEERAKATALAFPHLHAALAFLVDWPDHAMAAKLVEARSHELDGVYRSTVLRQQTGLRRLAGC